MNKRQRKKITKKQVREARTLGQAREMGIGGQAAKHATPNPRDEELRKIGYDDAVAGKKARSFATMYDIGYKEGLKSKKEKPMSKYDFFKENKMNIKKIIKEETRKYLNEMANPAAVNPKLLPKNLDDVDMETAKKLATSGLKDGEKEEDKVPVNKGAFTTAELKPSQSSMDINKALGMVISMLDPKTDFNAGGDIGAFISSDKYIMDGHHRWIATSMIDPSKKIIGYAVNFPGEKLVAVLNTVTKGMWNIGTGKKAKGGFEQFTPQKIGEALKELLTKGGKHHTPEQVQEIVKAWAGSPKGFVKKVVANLSKITMATPGWASGRPQMPVIDPDITKDPKTYHKTVGALQKGMVNVNPPYKIQEFLKRIIKEELRRYL